MTPQSVTTVGGGSVRQEAGQGVTVTQRGHPLLWRGPSLHISRARSLLESGLQPP